MKISQVEHIQIHRISSGEINEAADKVAVEEPLQLQVIYSTATGQMLKDIAVTMRTPGNDEELATGFLFTEGIINSYESISEIKHAHTDKNLLQVILKENIIQSVSINIGD